jgi:cytochrome P450
MTTVLTRSPVDHEALTLFQRMIRPFGRPDPYPGYAQLRERAPVLRSSLPAALGGYVLSRYEDCAELVRSRALLTMSPGHMDTVHPGWRTSSTALLIHQGIGFQNAQDHTRLRKAIAPHFSPRRVAALRTMISGIVEDVLDAVEGQSDTAVDFVETVARPLPVRVMKELFEVDGDTANTLARLGHAAAIVLDPIRSPGQQRRMEHATEEIVEEFTALIDQRSANPDESLLSAVISACDTSTTREELLGNLIYLFTAGHETLVGFLSLAVNALLGAPDQADLLRREPQLAEAAVEELLRFDAPIQMLVRVAGEPLVIGEEAVEPGTPVLGLVGAANRDPEHVSHPDRLDLTRASPRPLSFGGGPHYCVGAFLARLEAQILLPRLLERFPALRLAGTPKFRAPGVTLRGLEHLPVAVGR